jgi:N-methylhydantoinase B
MRRMIRDCSVAIGERLERIPDGEWSERFYMAGLGAEDRAAHRFSCRIRKQGDRLVVSNEGTDPQYKAASSAYGSWRSGVLVAVGSFLGWDQLLCNAGALDHVSFEPTPGTLSVATYPAATTGVGGNTAAVYLSAFTVSKMLMSGPEDLARRANGAGGQSIPSFWFGAGNDRKGRFVVQPPGDVVAGALGAFPDRDGVDVGGAWWWPNNPSGNTEEWEDALPVLYLYRRERQGSGGPGRWRGGNALETAIVLHKTDEMMIQLVSLDNAINCALGLGGGLPAHPGDYRFREAGLPGERLAGGVLPGTPDALERDVGELTRLFAKEITMMHPGDVFVAQYCGGGGFGDPLTRRLELVAGDVSSGAITFDDARGLYGVVLDGTGSADPQATDELRKRMRADRLAAARPPVTPDEVSLDREAYTGSAGGAVGFGPASDGEEHWGCLECGHALAPIDHNYKDGAARLERAPQAISPRQYLDPSEFCDDAFVVREFLCPGCGVTLATELCKPDDPPVVDARLSAREQVTA